MKKLYDGYYGTRDNWRIELDKETGLWALTHNGNDYGDYVSLTEAKIAYKWAKAGQTIIVSRDENGNKVYPWTIKKQKVNS
jgi:hypothetical protein